MLNKMTPKLSSLKQYHSLTGSENPEELQGVVQVQGLPGVTIKMAARTRSSEGFTGLSASPAGWRPWILTSRTLHRATYRMAAGTSLSERPKREQENHQTRSSSVSQPHLRSCFPSSLLRHVCPADQAWGTRSELHKGIAGNLAPTVKRAQMSLT